MTAWPGHIYRPEVCQHCDRLVAVSRQDTFYAHKHSNGERCPNSWTYANAQPLTNPPPNPPITNQQFAYLQRPWHEPAKNRPSHERP